MKSYLLNLDTQRSYSSREGEHLKILNFLDKDGPAGGVLLGDTVYPFAELSKISDVFKSFQITDDVIASNADQNDIDMIVEESKSKLRGRPIATTKILAPVLRSGKILCIGVNYMEHAKESRQKVMEHPTIFCKFQDSIIGNMDDITVPKDAKQIDYEGELVVIIGRSSGTAESSIFGYTIGNDVSARDLQFRTSQWLLGKALPTFAPIGPVIVGKNELGFARDLQIITRVNGTVRQNGNTSDMIFDVRAIVDYLSGYFNLGPGDIIFTGTPEGVILGLPENERVWLKHGDVIDVSITGIGTLTNRIN